MAEIEIALTSGRKIWLERLIQAQAYAGMLEGTPNKRSNDTQIQWALDEARDYRHSQGEPLLIDPDRRDYFRTPGDMQHIVDQQLNRPPEMRHPPEWLPGTECIGVFGSVSPARDLSKDCSCLTIVWYQPDFGFDISAVPELLDIDWDRYAVDCEY